MKDEWLPLIKPYLVNRTVLTYIPGVVIPGEQKRSFALPKMFFWLAGNIAFQLTEEERETYKRWQQEFLLSEGVEDGLRRAIYYGVLRRAAKAWHAPIKEVYPHENMDALAAILRGATITCLTYGVVTRAPCDILKENPKPSLKVVATDWEKEILVETYGYDPGKVLVIAPSPPSLAIFASQDLTEWTTQTIASLKKWLSANPGTTLYVKPHPSERHWWRYWLFAHRHPRVVYLPRKVDAESLFWNATTLITYWSTAARTAWLGGCRDIICLRFDDRHPERLPEELNTMSRGPFSTKEAKR